MIAYTSDKVVSRSAITVLKICVCDDRLATEPEIKLIDWGIRLCLQSFRTLKQLRMLILTIRRRVWRRPKICALIDSNQRHFVKGMLVYFVSYIPKESMVSMLQANFWKPMNATPRCTFFNFCSWLHKLIFIAGNFWEKIGGW